MSAIAPGFSATQLDELLGLIKGADSVELKLTIPDQQQRPAISALGLDPMEAQIRQVFFFDTPDLQLDAHGVVVRARRIQGKGADTVVKLRPVVPADLPADLRRSASFRVEVDALPGGYVCSATLKGNADPDDVKAFALGRQPLRKLFSKEQRAFYAEHAPEGVSLDDLTVLGPIFVLKLRLDPPELGRRLVAEIWMYPDDSHVLELSTRCETDEAFDVAATTRAFLGTRGIEVSGEQSTKTRKALEYFSAARQPVIVPRWEWRTFGEDFGKTEALLAALTPGREQESDEVYLLSARSDASVKVRDAQMDVKQLEQVADGLEQWRPVMKASFPLPSADVLKVLAALDVHPPPLVRDAYTIEEFIDDVVEPHADLRAVEVHKQRQHHLVGECMVELSEVTTTDGSARTIAIESEDPALVTATVAELGLAGRRNVSFARGLKQLTGFGTQRFAVIDVGTNSVKFHVGERNGDGTWTTVVDRSEVTRLGDGLAESGELGDEPIARTVAAVADMAAEAKRDGVAEIAAVGTAGLRAAPNRNAFIAAVERDAGIHVEVISGEEEARLAYLAATSALHLDVGSLVVFDSGGGSSQFTFGNGREVTERFSVDVGAIRFTERFGLDQVVSKAVLDEALAAIGAELERLDGRPTPDAVIGMGGTVTNLAAVKHELAEYDPDIVQGTVLDRAEIDRQIALYRKRGADGRRKIVGLQPKRAEIILAGACIARTVLEKLGADSLTVSDRALRHGLLAERWGS
jgi:exopolyphosphatase/guanosine-5'-triphosphate,3'-diphosphate pyrophosphatase